MNAQVLRYVPSVRCWVEMPSYYDPARITAEDCTHDSAMRALGFLEEEGRGLVVGREGETVAVLPLYRVEGIITTLQVLVDANADAPLDPSDVEAIQALSVGGEHVLGGGAVAECVVRRVS